jgi:hypothetical protein
MTETLVSLAVLLLMAVYVYWVISWIPPVD